MPTYRPTRRKPVKSLASAFALALSLAGGAAISTAAFAPAVAAQEYSKDFIAAYQPVADVVNAPDGDVAAVRSQFPTIVSLIKSPDERFAAGNLILAAGNKLEEPALQRQGLELQLESGKVDPSAVGQYQWFVGNLAFQMEDYAAAREALQAAVNAGYNDDGDPTGLMLETYFAEGNAQAGVNRVIEAANQRVQQGGEVPQQWLLRGLQAAYDNEMTDAANELSLLLVENHPSERNWTNALQVVGALNDFEPQPQLDLLRLMRHTDVMSNRAEYARYIENADPRIMANEVEDVLEEGLAAGQFEPDDSYYVEVKSIVDSRVAQDREDAPGLVAEAEAGEDAESAMIAADVLYSLDNFAEAERLYRMAAERGADRDTALTRVGMAQVMQGKYAEAQETLAQVSGQRETIAELWAAYAAQQQAG